MREDVYQKALAGANEEMKELLQQRNAIDNRIARLTATIAALGALGTETPRLEDTPELGDLGISDAIRQVLKDANQYLTPAEIKVLLIKAQVDLNKYANASAVIHNTLKRLEAQGELATMTIDPGIVTYSFKPRFILQVPADSALASLGVSFAAAMEAGKIPKAPFDLKKNKEEANNLVAKLISIEGGETK
jgi:hypothetical protein